MFIDSSVSVYNNQPFVQRHFDITPATNAANARATVTLYFTQQDFDNFNAYVTTNNLNIALLPAGGTDNGNIRIMQFHGAFTGASYPGNYADTNKVLITPNVIWDNGNSWWAVAFPVSGFSGFYLITENTVLPLTLLQFSAQIKSNKVLLQWRTDGETNTRHFEIECKSGAGQFAPVGWVTAQPAAVPHTYTFTDPKPGIGTNFYRLKAVDGDGKFTYSKIVAALLTTTLNFSVHPNPVKDVAGIFFNEDNVGNYVIRISTPEGKLIKNISGISNIGSNKINIDLRDFSKGFYIVTLLEDRKIVSKIKLIKE